MSKILDTLYEELDFNNGSLFKASDRPTDITEYNEWLEKGEWLSAAKRAGADKLFFVENNPVAVFAECGADYKEKIKDFNQLWSLGRPRLLFLISPGEIFVMDLAQSPLNYKDIDEKNFEKHWRNRTLEIVNNVSQIARKLNRFHRDNIESGKIFGDDRFGDTKNRADISLIRDLKTVRHELMRAGLYENKLKFAHALIGRSIFICYLEDRGIITKDYFLDIASQNSKWIELINNNYYYSSRAGFDYSENSAIYPRILEDKAFTYSLFRALARDFNGDMFPDIDEEEKTVTQEHIKMIQNLLYGDVGIEKKLFFHSYRFDIIPIDLISSIYEEFYHLTSDEIQKKSKARQDGAFYTPPALVEFVLSRTLTINELQKKPRILDPACGSGIFLVEAFRRIVRYEWLKKQKKLTFEELQLIIQKQIAGIEVNEEAARITAFSLYLAMLHYLDPPAITEHIKAGNRLPNLLISVNDSKDSFNTIWVGHAFDADTISANTILSNSFGNNCADIIISNPPWGALEKSADAIMKVREKVMLDWCHKNNKPIGDKEPSQAFLWRFLDFLTEGGKAGVLVPAGVLFKHSDTTQSFREQWIDSVRLNEVFNFTHVRKFFFKGADSPFLLICFDKANQDALSVKYYSVKQVMALKETQALLISKYDVHTLKDISLTANQLWKCYWFGRTADANFLRFLQTKKRLNCFVDRRKSGQGISTSPGKYSTDDLNSLKKLDIKSFHRYVSTDNLVFVELPDRVYRLGVKDAYLGPRVLIKRGINEKDEPKGQIIARYEEDNYCFTNAINGIKLKSQKVWQYKVLLGIVWSSLSRYYFFLTSSNWGLWHHEIHLEDELLQLPVIFDENHPSSKIIIDIVDKLRRYHPQKQSLLHPDSTPEYEINNQRIIREKELDEAVFDLYGLSEDQKDLIRDCCEVTLPFFYRPLDSTGVMPAIQGNDLSWIENYIRIFSRRWNTYLDNSLEMRADVHVGAHENIIAVEFYPADRTDPGELIIKDDTWDYVLEEINKVLPQPLGTSQILVDGIVHIVSDDAIVVIKRNEKRYWTRSSAREDADTTLCKRMVNTKPENWEDGT